jgi:hypothetical protein
MNRSVWNRESQAVAVAMPFPAAMEESWMQARLEAVRDTLIVIGLQIVFRVMTFLRHCNY